MSVVQIVVNASIEAAKNIQSIDFERSTEEFDVKTIPILAAIKADGVIYPLASYSTLPTLDAIPVRNPDRQLQKAYLHKQ